MSLETAPHSREAATAAERTVTEVEQMDGAEKNALRPFRGLAIAIMLSVPVWLGLGAIAFDSW